MATIDLIAPALPPAHDAIGEYTSCLATALACHARVRILTATDEPADAVPDAEVVPCFSLKRKAGLEPLADALAGGSAQTAVVQYNPFGWGRRGFQPRLVSCLRRAKRLRPDLRLGVMFHENFTASPGWKARVMRQWQRWQYRAIADLADVRFFSIERWAEDERRRSGRGAIHLPVGSNLPFCPPERARTRAELGIPADALVCGVFGTAHPSRLLDWVGEAARTLARDGHRPVVLYIGTDGDEVRRHCTGVMTVAAGRLPADEAAACFGAMDLFLSPFIDGVSTRRGSVMAALQHGVAVVTTPGSASDETLLAAVGLPTLVPDVPDRAAFVVAVRRLARHPRRRAESASQGRAYYRQHCAWHVIAELILKASKA